MTTQELGRILIIGLDGATWDVIDPWIDEGILPNLAMLRQTGCWGKLISTIPPISAAAWSTFMTGKRPGKHGVFHFIDLFGEDEPAGGKSKIVNARGLKSSTLWDIMGHQDRRVVLINVPMTYPPRPVNGLMITGLLTPGNASTFTYPPELSEELSDYVIDLDRFIDAKPFQTAHDPELTVPTLSLIQEFRDMLEKRAATSLSLMSSKPWDVFMVVFTGTDRLGHYLWPYHHCVHDKGNPEAQKLCRAVRDYYVRLDEVVGELVEGAGEGVTTVVVSDHGMGPRQEKRVHWNSWLHQHGWLSAESTADRITNPDSWLRRLGLPRDKIGKLILRVPGLVRSRVVQKAVESRSASVDVERSQAYCVPVWNTVAGVRINLEGERKEALIQEIVGELERIVDPENGQRVVQQVYRGEDVYHGPYADSVPDLMISMKQEYVCSYLLGNYSSVITDVHMSSKQGNHRLEGVFIASGDNVVSCSQPLGNLHIEDVAPSVLYLMGLPVPIDIDGRVLTEIMAPKMLETRPVVRGDPVGYWPSEEEAVFFEETISEEDEQQIERRLRALGYLD